MFTLYGDWTEGKVEVGAALWRFPLETPKRCPWMWALILARAVGAIPGFTNADDAPNIYKVCPRRVKEESSETECGHVE